MPLLRYIYIVLERERERVCVCVTYLGDERQYVSLVR